MLEINNDIFAKKRRFKVENFGDDDLSTEVSGGTRVASPEMESIIMC